MCNCTLQAVIITDPVLATCVLRDKVLDKVRFQYHFLDPVRNCFLSKQVLCIKFLCTHD